MRAGAWESKKRATDSYSCDHRPCRLHELSRFSILTMINRHPCAPRPPKMRRLNWPKQPVDIDAERRIEIKKWRSIIEAVGPERCKLAHDLMYARNDEDKWRTLAVFHLKALDSTRLDYGGP